ncbi:GNAT family N-acetyltransferase [Curtobacterium sp. AB451]|uniref:GNAT family N-acetyltransferase n=1 Tax=Curtobacterium sp. AB451 TaxID=3422306 RepID=UPI003D330D2D
MDTRLRLISVHDAGTLAAVVTASAEHLRPWEPTRARSYFTEAGQHDVIVQALAAERAGTSVPFVIESGDGELLGRITLSGITRGALQSCAMGYWIRADRLRQGHASRAVRAAAAHAFEVLGLHRVQAETLPENLGSQRALLAAGFERYGLAPEYLRIDGAWRDHVMFQLLATGARGT